MNFNAFFLDKLNDTNNFMGLNSKKFNPNSYLFSNVIKVEEANSSQPLINQTNNQNLTESETTTPTENAIYVSEKEINQLSDFITHFISNTDKQLKSSETAQSPSSIENNKKKLNLNEDGLNSLLVGIVQIITTQNQIYTKDLNVNPTNTNDAENTNTVTQSLLNLLSQVNVLNLSFKSSSQKISINIVPDEQKSAENLSVDNSATLNYNAEITQIFSPTENNAYYTSNDNLTSSLIDGDNSTNKFFQENTSISTEQPSANLFVQPSKSMLLGYINLGISGNFASNQKLNPIDSSSNSDIQMPESTTNLANKNLFIEKNVKQILGLDQVTTIITNKETKVSTDSNCITQATTLDTDASSNINLIANQESTDGAKLQTGLKEVNLNSNDDLLSQLQNPSNLKKIASSNQSLNINAVTENNTKLKASINNDLEDQDIISLNKLNSELENKSTFYENIVNSNSDKAKQILNNDSSTNLSSQKSAINSKVQSTTEETIKNLFDNRKVENNQINVEQAQTKDAFEQLKNVVGFSQSLRKLSFYDNSNANQNRSETSTNDQIKNQDQLKNDSQPVAIVIDGNKVLNLSVYPDAKTNNEIKNSSKVGTTVKDDGNNNSSDESTPIIDTQSKNQDDKDFQKQKFTEIVKNSPVQNSTNTNDFEIEKIKAFTDIKTINDPVKTIKVSEIIPEFSKVIQLNEKQSLTFQLTPDNLGKVKLVVDLVQNQINTRMVVENNQIKQFIQSNMEQLKQSLSSSGIDLNSVNISLANQDQKSNKSFSQRKKLNGKLESINPADNLPALEKKVMGYNTYEYLV
jgi:hypothetical protein